MLGSLKQLSKLLNKKEKIAFIILLVCMLLGALLEGFGISLIPAFVAAIANPEKFIHHHLLSPVINILKLTNPRRLLIGGCIFMIVIYFLKNAYLAFIYYLQERYIRNREIKLTNRLFALYMLAPYSFHLEHNSAELLRNVSIEIKIIAKQILSPLLLLLMHSFIIMVIIIILSVVDFKITLIAILILSITSVSFLKFVEKNIKEYGLRAQRERMKLIKYVNEGLGALKEVRILGKEEFFIKKVLGSAKKVAKAMLFKMVINKSSQPFLEFISVSSLLLIAILLLIVSSRSVESIGPILALFGVALVRLKTSVNNCMTSINNLRYNAVAIRSVYNHLTLLSKDIQPVEKILHRKISPLPFNSKIEVEEIYYKYPNSEEYTINGVSLTLNKGSSIAFVGSTGSGKTTLVDILMGILPPEKGEIRVDGIDIWKDIRSWQLNIGYVPQSIYLIDDTIKHNIALGVRDRDINEEDLLKAIEVAQLREFIDSLPQGINTVIGERGIRLSGGQRQRIGIARALYSNPKLLIMDEATSALDNNTERALINAIQVNKKDMTIIMIAHRLTTVSECDCLYLIERGKIVASGSYDKLLAENREFIRLAETGSKKLRESL